MIGPLPNVGGGTQTIRNRPRHCNIFLFRFFGPRLRRLDPRPLRPEAVSVQPLPPDLEALLMALRDRVLDENTRINLTALREPEKCWIGNVLDSLSILEILEKIGNPKTLIDVGTGGGFPLLPLALAMPDARLTGLDSTAKKIEAIRRIAKDRNIGNVTLVAARAEDAARDPAHREKYDVATARAVANLSVLLEYVSPFVRMGGYVVLWKSLQAEEEIAMSVTAQRSLHAHFEFSHRYTLPGDFGERQLLVFRKGAATPKGYPRPVGVPGKEPLGHAKA